MQQPQGRSRRAGLMPTSGARIGDTVYTEIHENFATSQTVHVGKALEPSYCLLKLGDLYDDRRLKFDPLYDTDILELDSPDL